MSISEYFFSPNRKVLFFSLSTTAVCVLNVQIYYGDSPVGGNMDSLRENGVQNIGTHTRHTYTGLDKKMDNN